MGVLSEPIMTTATAIATNEAVRAITCRWGSGCVPALRRAAAAIPFSGVASVGHKFRWCVANAPLDFDYGEGYSYPIGFTPLTEEETLLWKSLLAERALDQPEVMEWYPLYDHLGELVAFENKASKYKIKGEYALEWYPGRTKVFLCIADSWGIIADHTPGEDQF